MVNNNKQKQNEKGNVLFLILIAVALFAALSYAVTQSTRSGSGTADKEKSLLSSASMTQYPTALRTSIIRMVLGGTDVSDISFDPPANFGSMSDVTLSVFHPTGGGAVYQQAAADLMSGGGQGTWFFNAEWDIPQIGIDGGGGNDVIAFLPGISGNVCRQTNSELSIAVGPCNQTDGVPDLDSGEDPTLVRVNYEEGDTFPGGGVNTLQGDGCTAFSGQPSGCFRSTDNGGEFVYYSVLLER